MAVIAFANAMRVQSIIGNTSLIIAIRRQTGGYPWIGCRRACDSVTRNAIAVGGKVPPDGGRRDRGDQTAATDAVGRGRARTPGGRPAGTSPTGGTAGNRTGDRCVGRHANPSSRIGAVFDPTPVGNQRVTRKGSITGHEHDGLLRGEDRRRLATNSDFGGRAWDASPRRGPARPESVGRVGEPGGTRTHGPKIKSLVLYHLSYGLPGRVRTPSGRRGQPLTSAATRMCTIRSGFDTVPPPPLPRLI
jgi:hypothetical protein